MDRGPASDCSPEGFLLPRLARVHCVREIGSPSLATPTVCLSPARSRVHLFNKARLALCRNGHTSSGVRVVGRGRPSLPASLALVGE